MDHIKGFNEAEENEEEGTEYTVRVKHLIEYLQALDPEAPVHLDHDGWDDAFWQPVNSEVDMIKNRGIFQYNKGDKPYLIINN